MKKITLLLSVIFSMLFTISWATDFTVNTTDGGTSGSGTSGSLLYCINQAMYSDAGTNQRIIFAIPSGSADANGKYVITLSNTINLNTSKTITIDATTQPGYTCEPLVVLRGSGSNACFTGGSGGTFNIKGFIIQNWQRGIEFSQAVKGSIKACWIGLDNTGTALYTAGPIKESGIYLNNNGISNFTIGGTGCERNVISGTMNYTSAPGDEVGAIWINNLGGNGSSILIDGNYIGTDKTGTVRLGNGKNYPLREVGVLVVGTNSLTIANNVISGTSGNGIWNENSSNTVIRGNIIGLDATGKAVMGNGGAGIRADEGSTNLLIGGSIAADRNIISANGGAPDSRPCGQVYCGEPCKGGCPDKYDGTLQCGIYFKAVTNSTISGNYIGTDITGNSSGVNSEFGNLYAGIKFEDGSSNNTIGGATAAYKNVISGNGFDTDPGRVGLGYEYKGHGIQLNKKSVLNTLIRFNYIGLGADGISAVGNRQDGVSLLGSSNNTIKDNVISSNTFGVFLQSDFQSGTTSGQPTGNVIQGNLIGTDATGKIAVGNGVRNTALVTDDDGGGVGMQHGSSANTIGGTTAEERNVISGNRTGVLVRYVDDGNSSNPPMDNNILGNYIGVDITGNVKLPNLNDGILISGGANSNTIGGTTSGAGNIIAGNGGNGISLENADKNEIFNNKIGLNASGTALGNAKDGIKIAADVGTTAAAGSVSNIVGGSGAGQSNTIANNAGNGINILDAKSNLNSITNNSISCNTLRGIELNGVGNDNFSAPQIWSTSTTGNIIGEAPANSWVEFFAIGTCNGACSPQVQGKTHLGWVQVDGTGKFTFTMAGIDPATVTALAHQVTSQPTVAAAYNTSEFSTCKNVCTAPSLVDISSSKTPTICDGDAFPDLTATATGGIGPLTFKWYKGTTLVRTKLMTGTDSIDTYTPIAAGDYNVEVIPAAAVCSTASSLITVVVNPKPVVSVVTTKTAVCAGDSTQLSTSVTPAGTYTYVWVATNGQAAPGNVSAAYVEPTKDAKYTVIVTNQTTSCSSDSQSVNITVNPLPDTTTTITSGATTFCAGDSVTLSATAGYKTYQWALDANPVTGATSPTFVAKVGGTYTVTIGTSLGCSLVGGTQKVTVNANPVLTLSPSGLTKQCVGAVVSVVGTGVGNYEWFKNNITIRSKAGVSIDSIEVSTDGIYKLVLTDPVTSCFSSDTASISFENSGFSTISLTKTEFCEQDSLKLVAVGGGVKYQWYKNDVIITPGGDTKEYFVTEPGDYKVAVELTAGCKDTSVAASITMNTNPAVAVSASSPEVCAGNSVTISAVPSSGSTPYTYAWTWGGTNVSTASSFTDIPAATTTYSVEVTDAKGCKNRAVADTTVTVNVLPVANVSASASTICVGDTTILDVNTTPVAGTFTYVWIPSTSLDDNTLKTPVASPATTTTYKVVVQDAKGCVSDSAALTVVVNKNPVVSVTAPKDSICAGSSVTLSAVPTAGLLPFTYLWSNNNTDESFVDTPSGTTTYTVTIKDANQCSTTSAGVTVKVNDNPFDANIDAASDSIFCSGDSVLLSVSSVDPNATYAWVNTTTGVTVGTSSTYTAHETGPYTVIATYPITGCFTNIADTVDVRKLDNPDAFTADASGSPIFCDGGSVLLNITPPKAGVAYDWYFVSTPDVKVGVGSTISIDSSGNYTAIANIVYGTRSCSTLAGDTVTITEEKAPLADSVLVGKNNLCQGDSVDITVKSALDPGATYVWVALPSDTLDQGKGAAHTKINVNKSGKYAVYLQYEYSTINCASPISNAVEVTVNDTLPAFTVSASPDPELCVGETATLSASQTFSGNVDYKWYKVGLSDTVGTGATFTTGNAGEYRLKVTAIYTGITCPQPAENSVLVKVNPLPSLSITNDLTAPAICKGTPVTLHGTVTSSADQDAFSYLWSPGTYTTSTIQVDGTIDFYTLTVTDTATKCSNRESVDLPIIIVGTGLPFDTTLNICLNSSAIVDATPGASTGNYTAVWHYENNPLLYTEVSAYSSGEADLLIKAKKVGQERYTLVVTEMTYGCADTSSVLAIVRPLPVVELTSDKDTICAGSPVTLLATAKDGTPFKYAPHYYYAWATVDTVPYPNIYTDLHAPTSDSTIVQNPTRAPALLYLVTVTDSMGCRDIDSLFIHPVPHQLLVIPNLITPNGDNKNDELYIQDRDGTPLFAGATLNIYNRWGQAVYKAENYANNWKAANISDGVYYYTLETGCGDDGYKGWVQIIGNASN